MTEPVTEPAAERVTEPAALSRREQHKLDTRRALEDAALELFARDGFESGLKVALRRTIASDQKLPH